MSAKTATHSSCRSSEGTLAEVDPQEKPPRAPDLTSTFLELDILRRVITCYHSTLVDLQLGPWLTHNLAMPSTATPSGSGMPAPVVSCRVQAACAASKCRGWNPLAAGLQGSACRERLGPAICTVDARYWPSHDRNIQAAGDEVRLLS